MKMKKNYMSRQKKSSSNKSHQKIIAIVDKGVTEGLCKIRNILELEALLRTILCICHGLFQGAH